NAIKYGPGKPIFVDLQVSANGAVTFSVKDQGLGIAKSDQARIFGRFERAVSASNFGGLGLGLYIVSQILAAHGGKIGVESHPGVGSTFTVELPPETGSRAETASA